MTAVIAPNIYISRSFDSREAVIAKNFIRQARGVYQVLGDRRPLLVTLAVCREALLERGDFEEFLNDITMECEAYSSGGLPISYQFEFSRLRRDSE